MARGNKVAPETITCNGADFLSSLEGSVACFLFKNIKEQTGKHYILPLILMVSALIVSGWLIGCALAALSDAVADSSSFGVQKLMVLTLFVFVFTWFSIGPTHCIFVCKLSVWGYMV